MPGIYIHIPFCKQACHYCDFHFSTKRDRQPEMVRALCRELAMRNMEAGEQPVETIYFGGGTPSLLREEEICLLLETVFENYKIAPDPEITLEANPDDLSESKLLAFQSAGINRLSIGIQSFHEKDLKLMNRAHTALEAEACVRQAQRYFHNISVDLIYGIPYLSLTEWEENLQKALSLKVPHISSYALTVEPNTALKRFIDKGVIPPVDDAAAEAHFKRMTELLEKNGFVQYELSNFGKPGFFSRNNSAYWQGKHYLGIGPSAHSYDGLKRSWNISNNPAYLKALNEGIRPSTEEVLTKKDRYNEYIMTGLRTIWGVSMERVKSDFGLKYYEYLLRQAGKYLDRQLVGLENETLRITQKGKFLTDGIASDLFMI